MTRNTTIAVVIALVSFLAVSCSQLNRQSVFVEDATLPPPKVVYVMETAAPIVDLSRVMEATPTLVIDSTKSETIPTLENINSARLSTVNESGREADGSNIVSDSLAPTPVRDVVLVEELEFLEIGTIEDVHIQLQYESVESRTYTLHIPSATYIKLHVKVFDLAEGDYLQVIDPSSQQLWKYPPNVGTIDVNDPEFWLLSVDSDTIVLELVTNETSSDHIGIVFDKVAYGVADQSLLFSEPTLPTPLPYSFSQISMPETDRSQVSVNYTPMAPDGFVDDRTDNQEQSSLQLLPPLGADIPEIRIPLQTPAYQP